MRFILKLFAPSFFGDSYRDCALTRSCDNILWSFLADQRPVINLYLSGDSMTPAERIRKILTLCEASKIYEELILLGKEALPYPDNFKTPDRLIEGCQSELYLMSELKEGRLYFRCASEALISKGIACFATGLVDGLTPEEVLHYPFEEIRALKLPMILSPSRSSGLASVLKKIKMLALSELLRSKESPNS